MAAFRSPASGDGRSRFEGCGRRTCAAGRPRAGAGPAPRHWRQARSGEGQVVLLVGEPGIGKSRLVLALRERLRDEPYLGSATVLALSTWTARSGR